MKIGQKAGGGVNYLKKVAERGRIPLRLKKQEPEERFSVDSQ